MTKSWWRECWRAHRLDAGAFFVITIFFILFFYPIFFGGKFFVINDAFVYSYPLRTAAFEEVRHGRLPLWTPLLMSGYPLLSMAQIGIGYPLTWGYLFLPGRWAEQLYTLAPYLLTPLFIYFYARRINRSRLASLLAGLTFGYGGLMVSAVANNGLLPNALMWLPLLLIAIERARKRAFIPCLLGGTAAYSMSVLTGIGQGFVYAGALALAYAAFLALAASPLSKAEHQPSEAENQTGLGWGDWERWRPLVVAIGACVLSAGVAAFQILETMRAQRRSIRSILSYEIFTEGAYTFKLAIKSFIFPLHYISHATGWVSPLALVLAVLAIFLAVRRRDGSGRDWRIFFWLAVALVAWVLMLGASTPLYRLVYRLPVINSFRAPARHAFEWTFALAILSAYGWDGATRLFSRRTEGLSALSAASRRQLRWVGTGLFLLAAGAIVGLLWRLDFARTPPLWDESNHYPNFPEPRYLVWKLVLAFILLGAAYCGWRTLAVRWRAALLTGAIVLGCFIEPSLMAARWWWPALKSAQRFSAVSPATRFLQEHAPTEFRSYTRTVLWTEEYLEQPRLDSSNLTMLHGLRNTGGYEPLILERYSRALGNVTMDAASPRPTFKPDPTLFEPRSRVLDLLNTAFVVSYSDQLIEPTLPVERDGIRFGTPNISLEVKPGETRQLEGAARECDTLAIVSSMADSASEADGAIVARLRIFASDGRIFERELRAGVDTAEWAHDRSDVLRVIRHKLAPVFDSLPGDEQNSFVFHRYWTRIPLGERVRVERIEISNVSQHANVGVWKMTLYDSATRFSMPLPHYDLNRWEPAYEQDGVEIIRNKRVLPRVWLVAEAEAVGGEEALSRIRGEGGQFFDPARTALLEVAANELPRLPGGALNADATARITTAEPNRLVVDTNSSTATVLIASEINYPGWAATIDGQPAQIQTADFLLRAVALPAGTHRVEMLYTAPGARIGAMLSLLALLIVGALAFIGRHARKGDGRGAQRSERPAAAVGRDSTGRDVKNSTRPELKNSTRQFVERVSRSALKRVLRGAESYWGSLALCLVFSLVMLYNCVFPLSAVWQREGIVEPDCAQMSWNLWHVNEAIKGGHNPYASALVYYPAGAPNLSHHSLAAGFFPVTLLVQIFSGNSPLYPLYAYRLLILLCFTLLLYFSYWLLRELDFSVWASVIAAVAYSFSDFYMEHIAHLNMLAGFFIPLAALCLVRLYRRPERFSNIVRAALALSCAIYFTEFTLYIYLALLLFLFLLILFRAERQSLLMKLRQAGRWRLLVGLGLWALVVAPFLVLLLTDDFIKPPASETSFFSANLAAFFTPNAVRTPLYGQLFAGLEARITKGIGGYEVFTSFVLITSAVVALWKMKERRMRAAAILALIFYVLSLGPTLKLLSVETNFPLPYKLLSAVPPFDASRTPSRFVVMGLFFLMIVAACGLTWINRALGERRRKSWTAVVMSLIFVWATAETYSPTPRQPHVSIPQGLEKIVAGPVLNLPLVEMDGYALFLQLFHHQPISSGYLARSSVQRHAQFEGLRRLAEKGGAELCMEAERMGFRNLVIAPEAYWLTHASDTSALDLSQCRLNVVDLRQPDTTSSAQGARAQEILPAQPQSFPSIRAGTRVEFSTAQADPFLWYGWSGREPYSRWTERGSAAIVFALEETNSFVLRIRMSPFLSPGKLAAQHLRVQLNGETLATLALTEPDVRVYSITLPREFVRERNVLTFELPDAESPKQLGTGEDARLLGINVQWIELASEKAGP